MSEFKIITELKKTFPWKMAVIFLLFSGVIILMGIYYYRYERNRIFEEQEKSLSAIASLKIKQISQWYSDKLADAVLIKENEPLADRINQFLKDENQTGIRKEITIWLEALNTQYDYNSVALLDTLLRIRIATYNVDPLADNSIRKEINNVIRHHKIIMTDLHKTGTGQTIRMDILVPLLDPMSKEQKTIGLIILCIDPEKILFPLVQSWPTPSKSSETLILRREGDSVLYLNELRHIKNTALTLKFPLSKTNLLSSKAVNGFEGVTEGADYRNIAVIGALSKIPGLPWYMVAKTDKEEILAPFNRYSVITVLVIILLILINASIFGFWIWQQRITFYRNQLKSEISIRELEERFTTAFRMSPVSVTISSMNDNKFIDVNNTFLEDMEYKREEVIGRTARELNIWADENERLWIINEISEKGKIFGKVISYKTRTGKTLYGLSSMSVVKVNGKPCNLSTVVNITEGKKAELKLIESEELFRKLFENMLNGFAYCKMICEDGKPLDFLYLNVNKAFAVLTGLKDITGKKVSEAIPGIQDADPELLERYNRVSSTGIPEVFETYVESLKMWFAISVYSPQKGYFVAVFDVITERKLSEEKLHESRATLQSIVDNSNSLIYLVDTEGRFVMVNQPLYTLLSPSGEILIGKMREAFLPKEVADIHRKNDLEVIASGKTKIFEEVNNEPDGKHFYLTTKFPLFNNQDEIYAVGGLSTDITERRIAEENLRENEKRLREAQEMAHLGFWLWDVKTGNVDWSEEVYKIFLLDPETFIPKIDSILELSPWPEDHQRDKELIARAMKDHTPGEYEQKFLRPDKSIGYYLSTFRGSYDDNGDLISIVGTILDITSRKLSEMALRESEDKFKYVFDHSVIGKSITFPSGEIHVNKAFCDMLGYSQEELEKSRWQDISHPEDIIATEEILRSLLFGEKDLARFSKRYLHKNGSVLWTDVSTGLRRDAGNNPLYFITSVVDITHLKLAEDVLRNDQKRFRELIEALPQLYWTCRVDGPCDYLSRQWVEFTGITESEQLGYRWLEQLHPEDREMTIAAWSEKVKTGTSFDIEFRIRRYDGEYHWFKTRAVPIHDSEGKLIRWLGSNNDIDSIRKAEDQLRNYSKDLEQRVILRTEQLEAANKELEAFSYSVSHDLRAPLRSVHGFTKILLEDYESKLDDEGKRICGIISSSATQMGALIDDLLSFSRIGRSTLNPSVIDMKKMARVIFETMTSPAERERIKLSIGKMQLAFGDVTLFGQVWTNLISNAIKYTSKNNISEINIGSRVDERMITYFIKDNGVGFETKYAHKLFGVFQRLHSESEFEGNGVGLAIIQRIILKHGGKVWAEGKVGKGATFFFSLPVQDINKKTHDTRLTTNG